MTHPGETAHKQRAGEAEADACLELMRATVRKLVPHVYLPQRGATEKGA